MKVLEGTQVSHDECKHLANVKIANFSFYDAGCHSVRRIPFYDLMMSRSRRG